MYSEKRHKRITRLKEHNKHGTPPREIEKVVERDYQLERGKMELPETLSSIGKTYVKNRKN